MIQFSSSISISLIIISVFIFSEIFPKNNFFKNFYVIFFILFNSFFFIKKTIQVRKTRFWPSIIRLKKLLQNELKLENNELLSLNDKQAYQFPKQKNSDLWNIFQSEVSKTIVRNYSFKLKYFFLDDQKKSKDTILSIFFLSVAIIIFSNDQFNRSFFNVGNYQNYESSINNYSTNIWIYPPLKSKNDIIFLEKNANETDYSNKNFLIEEGSRISINFFNLLSKDVSVILKSKEGRKKIKGLSMMDQNTIQLNTLLEEGEYSLIFKNKLFQKFNVFFDKPPVIEIIEEPKVLDKTTLSFSYSKIDENTKMIWLEIGNLIPKVSEIKEPILSQLNKIHLKPINYLVMSSDNEDLEKVDTYFYEMDITSLPITGNKVSMRLGIIDQNNQLGSSKIMSIFLPRKIFYDSEAKKIILIRQELYERNDISETLDSLRSLKFTNKEKIKNLMENIINFLENSKRDESYKIEKFLEESWKIAVFLETTNLDNISNNIMKLKKELELMIKNQSSDKELSVKIDELSLLLRKYEKLTQKDIEKNNEKGKTKKSEVPEDLLADKSSIKNMAENLINRVEQLFDKKNVNKDEVNELLLDLVQDAYIKQKDLIEETYNSLNDSSEKIELSKQQMVISEIIKESYGDISKVIPSDKELLNDLETRLNKSYELLKTNKKNDSVKVQTEILSIIKAIYNKIQMNSTTSKTTTSDSDKGNDQNIKQNSNNSENQYDTPIIFETNDFDQIIKRIREMANEKDRKTREKEYLKNLLPKF
ncbi:DUF4175 family protein [Rickettsiales bacterium]|nr:DUF4175 family protein [Rickettsiales bacterium]